MLLTVNGKEVNLSESGPLTLGDFRKLKKDYGVEQKDLANGDIEVTFRFTLYVLKKIRPDITEADVDSLTMGNLENIMTTLTKKATDTDHPTLT